MRNEVIASGQSGSRVADGVLKATSLIYFKEALVNEQYEDCADFIRTAQSFGAQQSEISRIIAEVIRTDTCPSEATGRNKSRRRF